MADKGRRRTRHQKHDWSFRGLLTCGHCGCALTAEIKKGKYVYYHCTENKGKCPEKWAREEEVDDPRIKKGRFQLRKRPF